MRLLIPERLSLCKYSLIARVVLARGDKPWILNALKTKLSKLWNLSSWKLISMGKCYFQVLLYTKVEQSQIWSLVSINLKPGVLRLHAWSPDFNPNLQKSTNAQLWGSFLLELGFLAPSDFVGFGKMCRCSFEY